MVNQNQLLELMRLPSWRLLHRDAPYFLPHWDRSQLLPGFTADEQARIDALQPPQEGETVDLCLRIASPVRPGPQGFARRTVTFVVTEFGLSETSFEPAGLSPQRLTSADDFVVTPSAWAKARLVDYGFQADKVCVVPHGYKTDVFSPCGAEERRDLRTRLGFAPDEVVFLNVGVSTWNKGQDLLLLAFAQLRLEGLRVRLILKDHKGLYNVGVEQFIADLAARAPQVAHAQVQAGISVISTSLNLQQLRQLYAVADGYVSPYRAEGFNLPVLEAMGCGTPVIVTGGGATDDFVPNELGVRLPSLPRRRDEMPQVRGHYLTPDLPALIESMRKMARDPVRGSAEQEAARLELARTFNWQVVTQKLVEIF